MIPELFYLSREASRESEDGSSNSGVEPSRLLADFVGGLGPGQVAGRQALGAGSLGELQITLEVTTFTDCTDVFFFKSGTFCVEVFSQTTLDSIIQPNAI